MLADVQDEQDANLFNEVLQLDRGITRSPSLLLQPDVDSLVDIPCTDVAENCSLGILSNFLNSKKHQSIATNQVRCLTFSLVARLSHKVANSSAVAYVTRIASVSFQAAGSDCSTWKTN